MAKIIKLITETDDSLSFGDSIPVSFDKATILAALASGVGEVTPQGVVLWNGNVSARLMEAHDADGSPIMLTAVIRLTASPRTADEADKVKAAADLRDGKRTAKEASEENKREREIMRATEITRAAFVDATKTASAGLPGQIENAVNILGAIGRVKSLTTGA